MILDFQSESRLSGLAAFKKLLKESVRMPVLLLSRVEDNRIPTYQPNFNLNYLTPTSYLPYPLL